MAQVLLYGLDVVSGFQAVDREGMPIGYNKDKSGILVFSRVCGFVLVLFPLKNPPKMGVGRGGDK